MTIALEIITFCLLLFPLLELNNDRLRDLDKKYDVLVRACFIVAASFVNYFLRDLQILNVHSFGQVMKGVLKPLAMSIAAFFLLFDYIEHWQLGHKAWKAFTYLGTSKEHNFDKFPLWVRIGPWGRFAVKMVVFIAALLFYF